jgi:hypothetical protein
VNERRDIKISDTLTGIGRGEVAGYLCHAYCHTGFCEFTHDVYVEKDGRYALRIAARTNEPRKLYVDVNGRTVGLLTHSADSQQTVVVELKKGQNTVRLHNDHERMPDVDYLSVETK